MTTLSQKLRIILERQHEILVSEFQKALNIAFKRGDKIADACRYAFVVTHPITNEPALKDMTKIYSDIFTSRGKTMNQNKNLFACRLIPIGEFFKDEKEYWETMENLSPYPKVLLVYMACDIFQSSEEKDNNLIEMSLNYLEYCEQKINKTFFLDNVNKFTPLLREWANELVEKKFIEIREEK